MTSFSESEINRASDGTFAPKSTSESDIDWEAYHDPQPIDLGEDDLTNASITLDDDGRTSISAEIDVNFTDSVNPEVLDAHPVVAFDHVENRFGVSRIGTWDDPSEGVRFEMTSEPRYVDSDEEAVSTFYATTQAREFKDAVNGGPTESLATSVRRAYRMWGLDPDDEAKNDYAHPDLDSDELRAYIRAHGQTEGDVFTMHNPTGVPIIHDDAVVDRRSRFVVGPDDRIVVHPLDD